ncbi:MAG: NosD domain-containing protein [Promethearchaeota archaeon]
MRILLIFTVLFLYLNISLLQPNIINLNSNRFEHKSDLNLSSYWILSPFSIDDNGGGDYTWIQARDEDWCSGSGTLNDPYVIENITIDAGGVGNALVIRDSVVPFIIQNNKFINSGPSLYNAGLNLINVSNGILLNNNCSFNNEDGIRLKDSTNITIECNTLTHNERRGLFLTSSSGNTIINNTATHNRGTQSVFFSTSSDNDFFGNNVSNNSLRGIWLQSSSTRNNIFHNIFKNNGETGIFLSDSPNNTFSYNNITNNAYFGINLNNGHNTNIINNLINNNKKSGIAIYDNCYDSIILENILEENENNGILISTSHQSNRIQIANNNISKNYDAGIYFDNTGDNNVSGNIIKNNNNYGMIIYANYVNGNNHIFNNTFLNNTINAAEIIQQNNWNNSLIGNYWDDYEGRDLNGDGIGDSPYNISGSTPSKDYLPICVIKDTEAPIININYPKQWDIFGPSSPSFNLTITEYSLNTTWYSLNGGLNHTFTNPIGTINQSVWDSFGNETVTIRFYANDTLGNEANKAISVRKDLFLPEITINSPIQNQNFGISAPTFNLSILNSDLNKSWYVLNNGTKHFFIGELGHINQFNWDMFGNEKISLIFYANNSAGNIAFQKVMINKYQEISVIRPTPYKTFGNATFNFELLIDDSNVSSTWYSINGGLNYTFSGNYGTINQTAWNLCGNGTNVIRFYANNTKGETVFEETIISKDFYLITPINAYAIVVGIENYPGSDYDLNYCRDDATEVYSFLISECNFKSEHISLLLDSDATLGAILNAFSQIHSKIEPNDIFLFYFSGHGGTSGTQFICPYNSIPSTPSNYFYDNDLDSELDKFNNKEKYVLIDACNSGGMITESQENGRYMMSACQFYQDSYEIGSLRNGVFTYYFLRSKDYASDINGDGVISMEEQYIYTETETSWYMSYYYGISQDPREYDGISGSAVLYPSLGNLVLSPLLNQLDYSFYLYGHGYIKTLNLTIYSLNPNLQFKIYNLKYISSTYTGFGSFSGQVQLDEGYNITGYELLVEIEGNVLLSFNYAIDEDTDSDGLYNILEIKLGLNPLSNDTDGDDLTDFEEYYGITNPQLNDTDSDGLLDGEEINIYNTDPLQDDTDSDGLLDGEEINIYNTDPLQDDTDSDGLLDGEEINTYGTDPLLDDTDSDGLSDYNELNIYNTDPLNEDSDSDTMPDKWEIDNLLDPLTNDTAFDPDNDFLTNLEEFQSNTQPFNADTDSDGLLDGEEVNIYNTDPLQEDTDSDGLLDGEEVNTHSTDPLSGDTDSDTMPDKWEVDNILNPLINDTSLDPDMDELVNIDEYSWNTNPQNRDSDGDGWTDGDEVHTFNTDPLNPDDHPNPSPPSIPGYYIFIIIGVVCVISIITGKKVKNQTK